MPEVDRQRASFESERVTRDAIGLPAMQRIDSPEQVRLDLEIAGPMSRAFAYSIDLTIIMVVLFFGLLLALAGMQQLLEWVSEWTLVSDLVESLTDWVLSESDEESQAVRGFFLMIGIFLMLELVLASAYFLFFETIFAGRTPGKRWTQLRVVKRDGGRVGWHESLIRNLLRVVDSLPAGHMLGVTSMILSSRGQRLGDLAAGTLVIRERLLEDFDTLASLRVDPDVEAGFRLTRDEVTAIGETEQHLIRRTLRRAETMSHFEAALVLDRATSAICGRIGRTESIPTGEQHDFLAALLQASERLIG